MQCHGPDAQGRDCQFVQFKQGIPPLSVPAVVLPSASITAFVPTTTPIAACPISGCGKNRIAPDCERRWCRKHCSEAGGCICKTHRPVTSLSSTPFITPPVSSATPCLLPPLSQAPSLPTLQPSSSQSLDAQPNPRYVSHMPPIFTEQWRREQELQELKRQQEATRVRYATQAKQAVIIYAWAQNNEPAHVEEVQGLSWPYFPLTALILARLELSSSIGVQLYRHSINTWVNVSEGHIVDLQTHGCRIFLKLRIVTEYPDFDGHLHADSGNSPPNIRRKLKDERRELRERERMIKKGKVKQDVVELSSGSEVDDDLIRPRKRPCPSPSERAFRKPSAPLFEFDYCSSPGPESGLHIADEVIKVTSEGTFPARESTSSPNLPSTNRSWPADYHAIDIVRLYSDCSNHSEQPNNHIFEQHFPGVPYRRSTFSENRRRWTNAPQSVRDRVLKAKRTPEGLWSFFQSQTRSL